MAPATDSAPDPGSSRLTVVMTKAYTPSTKPVTTSVGEGAADEPIDLVQPKAHDGDAHGDGRGGKGQQDDRSRDRHDAAGHEGDEQNGDSGEEPAVLQALDPGAYADMRSARLINETANSTR